VYIPPSDDEGLTLDFLTEAYTSAPNQNWPVIVLGDLNMDMENPAGNNQPERIEDLRRRLCFQLGICVHCQIIFVKVINVSVEVGHGNGYQKE